MSSLAAAAPSYCLVGSPFLSSLLGGGLWICGMLSSRQHHQAALLLLDQIDPCPRLLVPLLIVSPGQSADKRSRSRFLLKEVRCEILSHTRLHHSSANVLSAAVAVSEALVSAHASSITIFLTSRVVSFFSFHSCKISLSVVPCPADVSSMIDGCSLSVHTAVSGTTPGSLLLSL